MAAALPSSSSPNAEPRSTVGRTADLQLRGRAGKLWARVHWPPTPSAGVDPAVLVLFPGGLPSEDGLGRGLCARAGAVVLTAARLPSALEDAIAVVEWTADHAAELGADPSRLVVGGCGHGAGLAAAVVRHARDHGWPPIARQLLVLPEDDGIESAMEGVAPATVVSASGDAGRRYAARLRRAGVDVEELRYDQAPSDEPGWDSPAGERIIDDLTLGVRPALGTRGRSGHG